MPESVLAGTHTLERALDVLTAVARSGSSGLSLARCTEKVGHSKPTTHRILVTLTKRSFLRFDKERGVYLLGTANLRLGTDYLDSIDLRTVAMPFLSRLGSDTDETVHLGILDGCDVVYIEKVDSPKPVRISSGLGRAMPAHSTAMGKALLAQLNPEELRAVLPRKLVGRTPATIVDRSALARDLAKARERGYALDDRENGEEIRCVAAAVFDHRGAAAASVSVSGPFTRMTDERCATFGKLVQWTCAAISTHLGHRTSDAGSRDVLHD
jgi:DNA-binding IclR family transcriptional regulator